MTDTLQSHIVYATFQYTMFLTTVYIHTYRYMQNYSFWSDCIVFVHPVNGLHMSITVAFS